MNKPRPGGRGLRLLMLTSRAAKRCGSVRSCFWSSKKLLGDGVVDGVSAFFDSVSSGVSAFFNCCSGVVASFFFSRAAGEESDGTKSEKQCE